VFDVNGARSESSRIRVGGGGGFKNKVVQEVHEVGDDLRKGGGTGSGGDIEKHGAKESMGRIKFMGECSGPVGSDVKDSVRVKVI